MPSNFAPLGATYQNSIRRTVNIREFHTFVRKYVGDVSSLILDDALQEAVRWFCDESRVLMDETTIHFQKNVRDYVLQIPSNQLMLAPELLPWWCKNNSGYTYGDVDDYYFRDIFGQGLTAYQIIRDGSQQVIEFAYCPRQEVAKRIPYSWAPQRDFCEVPVLLYDMWMLPIKYRAASEIMLINGEKFSSVRRSEMFAEKAKKGLERARRWKMQNYSQQPRRMRVRPFLRGSVGRSRYGSIFGGHGGFGGGF